MKINQFCQKPLFFLIVYINRYIGWFEKTLFNITKKILLQVRISISFMCLVTKKSYSFDTFFGPPQKNGLAVSTICINRPGGGAQGPRILIFLPWLFLQDYREVPCFKNLQAKSGLHQQVFLLYASIKKKIQKNALYKPEKSATSARKLAKIFW